MTPEESTHVDTTLTDTTSSISRTASGKVAGVILAANGFLRGLSGRTGRRDTGGAWVLRGTAILSEGADVAREVGQGREAFRVGDRAQQFGLVPEVPVEAGGIGPEDRGQLAHAERIRVARAQQPRRRVQDLFGRPTPSARPSSLAQMQRTVPVVSQEGRTIDYLGLHPMEGPGQGIFWGHGGTVWGGGTPAMTGADGKRQLSVAVNLQRWNRLAPSGKPQLHPIDDALAALYRVAMHG